MRWDGSENPASWSGGPKNVSIEGKYHVQVIEVRPGETKNGRVYDSITVEVLAGTAPSEVGKRASVTLFRNDGFGDDRWTDGYKRWAWAVGLLQKGQSIDFDPQMLTGGNCVVTVVLDAERKYANIGNRGDDVWHVSHPEVAGVPKRVPGQQVQPSQASIDGLF